MSGECRVSPAGPCGKPILPSGSGSVCQLEQLSVVGSLKAGLPCFRVMFRGNSVLENLLGSSGMFQWWNTTRMYRVVSRMSDMAGEGHIPFEGKLCLRSAAFTHWLLPRKSSQIAFCISQYTFYHLSAAGTKKSKFHSNTGVRDARGN